MERQVQIRGRRRCERIEVTFFTYRHPNVSFRDKSSCHDFALGTQPKPLARVFSSLADRWLSFCTDARSVSHVRVDVPYFSGDVARIGIVCRSAGR